MACKNPTVRVKQGELRGTLEDNYHGGQYLSFRGIPYAKPPTGPLRFKDPEPAEPWTGVRDALEFGNICAQRDLFTHTLVGHDDCLYLNVYTPSIDASSKRAVMVWIHGGAFVCGSGNSDMFGPDHLVRKDIVLVTINYRLAVLGFLNLEDKAATGNQGLKDQVMALKWVKENISSFGGDPNSVTIFGESAGAASVHYLALSPLAKGLFHKAIAQSGVVLNPWAFITKHPRKTALQFAAHLGKETTDPEAAVEFLRTLDAHDLIVGMEKLLPVEKRQVTLALFGPGVDDKSPNPFMPQIPSAMAKAGVDVPFLLGHNVNEGSFLLSPLGEVKSNDLLRQLDKNFELVVHPEMADSLKRDGITPNDLRRLYFGNQPIGPETAQEYANYMGDMMFLQGIYDVVNVQVEKRKNKTYLYKFTYDSPYSLLKQKFNITLPGTTHADELIYMFYPYVTKLLNLNPPEPGTPGYKVAEYFTQMWTDFAKTGNPTPMTTDTISTIWTPVDNADAYRYMDIGETLRMETLKREQRTFDWSKLKNKL